MNTPTPDTQVVDAVDTSKNIIISFTLKKLIVVLSAAITFLTSTVGPFLYSTHQKKVKEVEEKLEMKYVFDLKEAKYRAEEGDKFKAQFNTVVSQLQYTIDFLKLHSYYTTCYIIYSEKPNAANRIKFNEVVHQYALFIKNKKTFTNPIDTTSFYLSDEMVYIDGTKYIIPHDVLSAIRDIKNAN